MGWDYRVVKHPEGYYTLHKVFYDEGGPTSMTAEPVGFVYDAEEGPRGIIDSLRMALIDAMEKPVLVPPDSWFEEKDDGGD